jgi:hypothetical protein
MQHAVVCVNSVGYSMCTGRQLTAQSLATLVLSDAAAAAAMAALLGGTAGCCSQFGFGRHFQLL